MPDEKILMIGFSRVEGHCRIHTGNNGGGEDMRGGKLGDIICRDLFLRGLRAYVGFKQIGVPYVRPERAFGRSTNDLGRNLDWAKRAIFSFSGAPLTLLMNAGFALLVLSFVAAAIEAVLRIAIPTIAPRGITTVLAVTLFFGGLNLFAVGLVGEYVAKVLTEVKARPGFIRAARLRGGRRYDEPRDLLPPRSLT